MDSMHRKEWLVVPLRSNSWTCGEMRDTGVAVVEVVWVVEAVVLVEAVDEDDDEDELYRWMKRAPRTS